VVGLNRLLFSVDYPFSPNTRGRNFLNSIADILSAKDLAKLAYGNAESLLRLQGAS
jgi:predicted TIM-barrel fold metal-dependent hydrolase